MSQKRERPVPFGKAMARWLVVSFTPPVVISSNRFIGQVGRSMAVGGVLPSCPECKKWPRRGKRALWRFQSLSGPSGNHVL